MSREVVIALEEAVQIVPAQDGNVVVTAPGIVATVVEGGIDTRVTVTAGEVLGGHKAIKLGAGGKAFYASADVADDALKVIGISITAADIDATVTVKISGKITESTWDWDTTKPVFLGVDGRLTQTEPTSGVSLVMGWPLSATELWLKRHEPIILV